MAGPGVVLVRSANLALTWWLLAEFCAELNICDNRQHHWPVLSLCLFLSFVFTCFSFSILHLSLPSRIALCGGGVKTKAEKVGKTGTLDVTGSVLSARTHLHHCHISWYQGCEVVQTSGPSAMFMRSVGSICHRHRHLQCLGLWKPDKTVYNHWHTINLLEVN